MTQDLTHAAQVLEETENRAKAIVNFPNRRKASIHRFKNLSDSQAGKKKRVKLRCIPNTEHQR